MLSSVVFIACLLFQLAMESVSVRISGLTSKPGTMQHTATADSARLVCSARSSAAKSDNKKASDAAPVTAAKTPGSAAKASCKMPDQLASKAEPAAKPATAKKVHLHSRAACS